MTESQESTTVGIKSLAVLLVHIYENVVVKLNKALILALQKESEYEKCQ